MPDAGTLNVRADNLFREGKFEEAERMYAAAIASDPMYHHAYRGLGETLARRLSLGEAVEAHQRWFTGWIGDTGSESLRKAQEKAIARQVRPIVFVAMQKSASEFIRDTIIQGLCVPEINATIGTIPSDRAVPAAFSRAAQGGAIVRTHMSADEENLNVLRECGIDRLVVHVRDPRQVTISWVHMIARLEDAEFRYSQAMYSPSIPLDFRTWDFRRQLEWGVDCYLPGQVAWVRGWTEAAIRDTVPKILFTRYEDFALEPSAFFQKFLVFFGIDDDANADILAHLLTKEEARNYRKGMVDEWRVDFDSRQQAAAWAIIPSEMADRFRWTT